MHTPISEGARRSSASAWIPVTVLAALIGFTGLAPTANAQSHPNFSGTWILVKRDNPQSSAPAGNVTITHDAQSLTLSYAARKAVQNRYALNGSETAWADTNVGLKSIVGHRARVAWKHDTLIITTKSKTLEAPKRPGLPTPAGRETEATTMLWLDAGGQLMISQTGVPGLRRGLPGCAKESCLEPVHTGSVSTYRKDGHLGRERQRRIRP